MDNIREPKHYQPDGVLKEQPIEVMYRSMTYEAFKGAMLFNIFKYTSRFEDKGGEEDLDKVIQYVEFLRCAYRGESPLMAITNPKWVKARD